MLKKNRTLAFAVGGIVAVVFSAVIFMLWTHQDEIFWITYLFLLLGIISIMLNAAFIKSDNQHFASNLTLLTVSVVYWLIAAASSFIAIKLIHMRTAGYFVLHLVLFALFLCLWLIARSAVSYINKQD